ncbi:uncharacterized protein [Diabrotica undecimpunctata]|uniref:uncharacterized protein n=1 Tax=Diabrotica undecimpunctata TaxID=50387 RepID=UPI003B634F84
MAYRYKRDQARLQALWDDSQDDDVGIGSASENKSDNEDNGSHNSYSEEDTIDLEQSVADIEIENELLGQGQENQKKHDVGKDGTKWSSTCFPINVRTGSVNIITHLPGVKRNAKMAKTPMECFNLLFTPSMMDDVVTWTNMKIRRKSTCYDENHQYANRFAKPMLLK